MRNSTLTSIAVFDYFETWVCAALLRKKVGIHAGSWEKVTRKSRNMLSLSLFHNSLRNRCIHLSVFILFPNVSSFSMYSNSIFDHWSHVYDTQYYQQLPLLLKPPFYLHCLSISRIMRQSNFHYCKLFSKVSYTTVSLFNIFSCVLYFLHK